MRLTQQPACILHVRPWRETSLLLECLSRDHGRIGLVARGARSGRGRLSRAGLEPFQDLEIDCSGRGELLSLSRAEPVAQPRWFSGDGLYSGLYLNELLVRMLARQDPHPGLLQRYRQALDALAQGDDIAWNLRRFERDLMAMLGYALELRFEADSDEALDPERDYIYIPEQGPVVWHGQDGLRLRGADLLDFGLDQRPADSAMVALRKLMRHLIRWHSQGGDLRSWRVLAWRDS